MIIVDRALAKRVASGNPIRVALVGAGFAARGTAVQILTAVPGMHLVAIANRTLSKAQAVFLDGGVPYAEVVDTVAAVEHAARACGHVVTDDPEILCQAGGIDVVIEATGDVEAGSRVAYEALRHGKHLVSMSAEVDATVGPLLKVHADRAGVIYTYTDGDEPGVAMNLFRFVEGIGGKPLLMGQIKGFLDHYRNPDTQRAFAEQNGQKAKMVAAFADGSKLALESVLMGNATGFVPGVRGMYGHRCAHVRDLLGKFPIERFERGGLVDYVLGAEPHNGAFVAGLFEHPLKQQYLRYFKMGDGPLYMFYTPFHLPHMQLPHAIARAVLFDDATLTPRGAPVCGTLSLAKRDLHAGEVLDGMGGFTCYGLIDSHEACRQGDLLPIPISDGCRLKRDIAKDQPISYADVVLPQGRMCDRLVAEQRAHFGDTRA